MNGIPTGHFLYKDFSESAPLLGLDSRDKPLAEEIGPFEGESGEALWCCREREAELRVGGRWRVQCVDKDTVLAEHSVFAEDESKSAFAGWETVS